MWFLAFLYLQLLTLGWGDIKLLLCYRSKELLIGECFEWNFCLIYFWGEFGRLISRMRLFWGGVDLDSLGFKEVKLV